MNNLALAGEPSESSHARFAQFESYGPPDVLHIANDDVPSPGPDQLVIRMHASGINPFDVKRRAGLYAHGPTPQARRTGMDGAGEVLAIGSEVTDWQVGSRVLTRGVVGTAGTHLLARSHHLVALPPQVSYIEAAGVGVPFGTAYQAIRSLGVGSADTLLVHGGSGQVGQAAIQFALRLGANKVLATTSSARAHRVHALGAVAVGYESDLHDDLQKKLNGSKPTVILDLAGTDAAFETARLLDDRSRWATVVAGQRADAEGLTAFGGGSEIPITQEQNELRKEGVRLALQYVAEGMMEVEIGAVFALADISKAHQAQESGTIKGKLVVAI